MTTKSTTPPVALAVTLAAAKETLRIDESDTSLDASITLWIKAISGEARQKLRRSLTTQGWRLTLDAFEDALRLDNAPIVAVTSIKFFDTANVLQTLHPDDYIVDVVSEPGYVVPANGKAWPATYDRVNAVIVDYTAGYGDTADSVPAEIQQYILAKLALQFDGGAAGGTVAKPFNVEYLDRLLDSHRVY